MNNDTICSICDSDFDLDGEGGTVGDFGILPVAFCPTCLSCIYYMVDEMEQEQVPWLTRVELDALERSERR